MIWSATLVSLCALVSVATAQVKYGPYKGPPVVPVILPGGFLADTKEVAAAKEYFLNALAKTAKEVREETPTHYYNTRQYKAPAQAQQASYHPEGERYQLPQPYQPSSQRYQPQKAYQPQKSYQPQAQQQRYTQPRPTKPAPVYEGPTYDDEYQEDQYQYAPTSIRPDPMVTPIILDNGYIADTAEVNAAKEEHFAAVAQAHEALSRAAERASRAKAAGAGGHAGGYRKQAAPPPPPPPPQRFSADDY